MEPTKKAPAVEQLLEEVFGRSSAIKGGTCIPAPVGCGKPIEGFRDEISAHEYRISGWCQDCQDKVYGTPEEND